MDSTKIITSAEVAEKLNQRQALKAQIEAMTAQIKELEASIEKVTGCGTFHCNGFSITCGDKESTRFDTTRFKAEQPDVYKAYCKTSTVHSFTVRELIEK